MRTSQSEDKTENVLILYWDLMTSIMRMYGIRTYAASNTANTQTTIAKSSRSRTVMCASLCVSLPIIANSKVCIPGECFEPAYAARFVSKFYGLMEEKRVLGGVGGLSPTSSASGEAAVDMIPRTKIPLRVSVNTGDKSWPIAPPMGFAVLRRQIEAG